MKKQVLLQILSLEAFCKLSDTAKALYSLLLVSSDSKGFTEVHNAMTLYNAPTTALLELADAGFILVMSDNRVITITHWPSIMPGSIQMKSKSVYQPFLKHVKAIDGKYQIISKPEQES